MKPFLIALPLLFVSCETLSGSRDPATGVTTISETGSGTVVTVPPTGDSEIDAVVGMGSQALGLATGETGIAAIIGALVATWWRKRKEDKAEA